MFLYLLKYGKIRCCGGPGRARPRQPPRRVSAPGEAGPDGMPAGEIADALGIAPNTLTFHFDRLRMATLVSVRREGRSMIYAARFDTMNALLGYLTDNCCRGAPQKCAPTRRCGPAKVKRRKSETV